MVDLDIIRERYASMTDEKLIRFAREDSHDLTTEAFSLLQLEFEKRNLDINTYLPVGPHESGEGEAPLSLASGYPGSHARKARQEAIDNRAIPIAKLSEEELKTMIEKSHSSVVKNGVVLVIGLAITCITLLIAEGGGGTYVVAWGAILFGGIGFFRALGIKEKYQSALNDMITKKEELPENTI